MEKTKTYLFYIISAELTGALSALISRQGFEDMQYVEQSPLTPPAIVFPIVWTVLYLLMGIGAARIALIQNTHKSRPLLYYWLQLALNFIWTPVFFGLSAYLAAFVVIILLWITIALMIFAFEKVDRTAAYLQLPYLAWVTFAAYLNYATYALNR